MKKNRRLIAKTNEIKQSRRKKKRKKGRKKERKKKRKKEWKVITN